MSSKSNKNKSRFVCSACGQFSTKWFGRCPGCGEWNSAVEELAPEAETVRQAAVQGRGAFVSEPLHDVAIENGYRLPTAWSEYDRVMGGGLVPGGVTLLAGEPGVGKSSLLLQVADSVAQKHGVVLYISGEESLPQIRLRSERLNLKAAELHVSDSTDVEAMISGIRDKQPFWVIVDSIQTASWRELNSAPGSIAQVRDCAALLSRVAKETSVPITLVGQVTKDGSIAGPRILEHMVDTVLSFEGDPHSSYRILRCVKNRFGPTHEIGLFDMGGAGLQQITASSTLFLGGRSERPAGSVVTVALEGKRPILVEVQALVAPFHGYGFPRRTVTGVDAGRLAMLLAVLEKRLGLPTGTWDVFVNVAGGFVLSEPSADLAIAAAVVSSHQDRPLPSRSVVFGEIGLSGEIRGVRGGESRIMEASQLGQATCYLPRAGLTELPPQLIENGRLVALDSLREALDTLLPSPAENHR